MSPVVFFPFLQPKCFLSQLTVNMVGVGVGGWIRVAKQRSSSSFLETGLPCPQSQGEMALGQRHACLSTSSLRRGPFY